MNSSFVLSGAAAAALDEILSRSVEQYGAEQTDRLIDRLHEAFLMLAK